MSLFLLLLAKILTANGVTAVVCGDDLVIGARCPTAASAPAATAPAAPSRPVLSPPDGATPGTRSVPLDPKSISNGF